MDPAFSANLDMNEWKISGIADGPSNDRTWVFSPQELGPAISMLYEYRLN